MVVRKADADEVVRQYQVELMTLRQIAQVHRVCHETIRRILTDRRVPLRAGGAPVAARASADEVTRLRGQGVPIADIAASLGVSQQTVYRRLGGRY